MIHVSTRLLHPNAFQDQLFVPWHFGYSTTICCLRLYLHNIYIWYLLCPAPSLLIFRYLDTHRNTNIFTPVAQHGDPLISKPVVPLWLPGHPGFWGASHPILGAPTIGWREHFVWKTMEDLFVWRLEETWFPWFPYVSLKHFLLITQLHVYRETPWIPICQMTHTDLKPENILLAANAPPRRSDFPREDAWKDCRGAWGERKWNVVSRENEMTIPSGYVDLTFIVDFPINSGFSH